MKAIGATSAVLRRATRCGAGTEVEEGTATGIGKLLLGDYIIAFEFASILLLVALVGAAYLVRRAKASMIGLYHYLGLSRGALLDRHHRRDHAPERHRRAAGRRADPERLQHQPRRIQRATAGSAANLDAHVFAIIVIVLAAAEAAVALAIILQLFDKRSDVDVDRATTLRG